MQGIHTDQGRCIQSQRSTDVLSNVGCHRDGPTRVLYLSNKTVEAPQAFDDHVSIPGVI